MAMYAFLSFVIIAGAVGHTSLRGTSKQESRDQDVPGSSLRRSRMQRIQIVSRESRMKRIQRAKSKGARSRKGIQSVGARRKKKAVGLGRLTPLGRAAEAGGGRPWTKKLREARSEPWYALHGHEASKKARASSRSPLEELRPPRAGEGD